MQLTRFIVITLSALAASCVAAIAQDSAVLKQVQAIALDGVEGRIDHLADDPQRKRLYVAALGNDSLEVIDLAVGKRIKSVKGLKKPAGVRAVPGSGPNAGKLVVASGDDGMVRIYDADLKLLGSIAGLDDADNVRIDPSGQLAYVGYGDGALAVINIAQVKKVGEVKLDGHPESFQLEANGSRIWINVPSARHVAVIDREKLSVLGKWPMHDAQANFPMALDEANHRLFIGCREPARMLVLDSDTGKTIVATDCPGDTDDLFYDRDAHRLFITGGAGSIVVIRQTDADHYDVAATIATAAGARTSFFSSETRRLYVAVPHRAGQAAELRVYADAQK